LNVPNHKLVLAEPLSITHKLPEVVLAVIDSRRDDDAHEFPDLRVGNATGSKTNIPDAVMSDVVV
jgi:hypothetical protein